MNKNFPSLKYYREALGLGQKDLRIMLGYSKSHYQAVETGERNSPKVISRAWELLNELENKKGLDYNSLKVMRCMCGLTRSEAAKQIGISPRYYSLIETGKYKSSIFEDRAKALFYMTLEDKKCSQDFLIGSKV